MTGVVGELGTANPDAGWGWNLGTGRSDLTGTEREKADALRWPTCIETYDSMLNDAQVVALTSAILLPVQFVDLRLDTNGMDPGYAGLLADDLDLNVSGGRRKDHFNHRKHFGRALSALAYGHAAFEIVGEIDDAGRWRLRNLAPRPAWSIERFLVDAKGRLSAIEVRGLGGKTIELTAERVALWTWGGEVGDPRGESILRSLYRPWLLKDRGMRIDMIGHERNSMGIPIGWLPEGGTAADRDELVDLLSNIAAGESSNLVLPAGSDVRFRGVEGSTSNVLDSVKFCNEEMARALLGMIVQLGQTETGSRAVGDNFMDLLGLFHKVVVRWYADLLTEQVVEPWVTWNLGEDAPSARVVVEEPPETDLEEPLTGEAAKSGRPYGRPSRSAYAALPERELRREPFPHEVAAKTDWKALETAHVDAAAKLAADLADFREEFATVAAETVAGLGEAALGADRAVVAEQALVAAMLDARSGADLSKLTKTIEASHKNGIAQVLAEAKAQKAPIGSVGASYAERALGEAGDLLARVAAGVRESALGAVRIGGENLVDLVVSKLADLTSAQLDLAASSAISRAELAGRVDAIAESEPTSIYASELLDSNTCAACESIDGTEYGSLEEASLDYPTGGFVDCEGGERCRGTLVVVYASEGQEVG